MASLATLRENGHWPTFLRHRRGTTPFGGAVYGYRVKCECGEWERRINGPKREATKAHNNHLKHLIR